MTCISKYICSILLISGFVAHAQQEAKQADPPKLAGLRLGIDMSRYIVQIIDPSIRGWEANADYEFKENLFAAVEVGNDQVSFSKDNYDYNLKGTYFKLGVDYDLLQNTKDSDLAYLGIRYGFSTYRQRAENITLSNYWGTETTALPEEKLNDSWLEAVIGIKTELFFAKNFFIGLALRGKLNLGGNDYQVLAPYTIPGFGKAENKSNFGISWSLLYRIPIGKGK